MCEQAGENQQPEVRQRPQKDVGGTEELEDEQLPARGDQLSDVAKRGLFVREVPESKGAGDEVERLKG